MNTSLPVKVSQLGTENDHKHVRHTLESEPSGLY